MSNDPEGNVESGDDPADDNPEGIEETTDSAVDAETEAAVEAEETESAEESDEETAEETEGFQYGDFIRIEYDAWTAEDGHLVDTTDGDLAEEEGIDEGDREFGPRTVVLGEGHIFEPVEEELVGTEVGDTGTTVIPPEQAFGEYDEEQVRTVSKDKIPEDDQYPGAQVRIDGEMGFVETIIGGRARVDFNHPLAGDTLEYEWEVVGSVGDREERARDLLRMFLDIDLDVHFETDTVEEEQLVEPDEDETAEDVGESEDDEAETESESDEPEIGSEDDEAEGPTYETVEVEKESLYIDATPELTMNQQWMMGKQQIGQQLIDLLDIDRIVVQEVIEGGGFPGMMGGMGGGGGLGDPAEEVDVDADELAEELEEELGDDIPDELR